jgi:hypothetical protein
MMKTATALFVLLLAAATASAQSHPDYSRDTLMKLFVDGKEKPKRDRNVHFDAGAVEFSALGTRWRFPFVPLMALPGTRFTTTREWPDAFSLLGTPIATPRRAWRTQRRQVNAELKRIEKVTKPKAKIKVTVD